MKRRINKKLLASITAAVALVLLAGLAVLQLRVAAQDHPFDNLFVKGFEGYTTGETEVLTADYVSSKAISVKSGETVWFGPCEPTQYFQLVGFAADGSAATGKIRGKELTVSDEFENGLVIYQYTVPDGVVKLIFSAQGSLGEVYAVAKTELTNVKWRAYWSMQGVDVKQYVGTSSYYEVAAGDKLYFGAVTEAKALESELYNAAGSMLGTISASDLRLVESFGGALGIYCYTVPKANAPSFVRLSYDSGYEAYYTSVQKTSEDNTSDEAIVDSFIAAYGVPQPAEATVEALSKKSALFVGDSITAATRDSQGIYGTLGWAGRIGYYCQTDVTNNGVSGACISTARLDSGGEGQYIYNNLVKAKDNKYDYVIMHGLYNDASEKVTIGTPQGAASFDPDKADAGTFSGGLELLFYTAKQQHPEAILGFIVNYKTQRDTDDEPYVNMAIRICEDWGIPYLNLYERTDITIEFDDGLHANSAGYDNLYTHIADWMAGLAGGSAAAADDIGND